jgi:carbamoyltransferase
LHGTFAPDQLPFEVARLLAEGNVIGWFQGNAEWGPRALGNRSILADPTRADMKKIVNERIKFREPFRPFAPAVMIEEVYKYFECPELRDGTSPEYFMLAVHRVLPAFRAVLPAITHADGTARLQVVDATSNPIFYSLLKAFKALRGVGVLMNTSYNLKGEPIVDTPADALRTFSYSGLDYVVLGNRIVSKDFAL